MRFLLAPDKFKGCLSAAQVAAAMARGIRSVLPDAIIDQCPVADGGEGTVAALVAATNGRFETRRVAGPLPDMRVDAQFGILGSTGLTTSGSTTLNAGTSTTLDGAREPSGSAAGPNSQMPLTAVIEMSAASGLALLPAQDRDPMRTTTYGTGELLLAAAKLGATKIILGIGGSATVDGGIGCAQAAGLPVILDGEGPADSHEPLIGEDLRRVVLVKHGRGSPLDPVKIIVASDVTNPLFGPSGAAKIFGPQKGATAEQIEELDALLKQLAERCDKLKEADTPGAGAAGGLGFAMLSFFNATLKPGFEIVADAVRLRERLQNADLVLTGEGRLDASSFHGKAAVGVTRLCNEMNIPCVAIAGQIDRSNISPVDESVFASLHAIGDGLPSEESHRRAAELIETTAATIATRIQSSGPALR